MRIEEEIKQGKFKSSLQKAMINIYFTNNWLKDLYADVYKNAGILSQHYNVLRIVNGKKGEPAYPGDIKEVMLDKGRDLTRLVDKLVEMGYLERNLCSSNRRKMEIFITKKGISIMNKIDDEISKITDEKLSLSEEDSEQLSVLLDKMRG